MGTAKIVRVIPAYPVNFRISYRATYTGRLGLLADQSNVCRLFDGCGSVETDGTMWQDILFGIEYLG